MAAQVNRHRKAKTVYISVPLNIYDSKELPVAVRRAKIKLLGKMECVFLDPFDESLDKNVTDEKREERNIEMLLKADAIYLVKDWFKSRYCRTEYQVAQHIGKEILYEMSVDKKLFGG